LAVKNLRTTFLESIQNQINQASDFPCDEELPEMLADNDSRLAPSQHLQKRISPWEAATLSLLDKNSRFDFGLPVVKVCFSIAELTFLLFCSALILRKSNL
jgi:hypothetical protein